MSVIIPLLLGQAIAGGYGQSSPASAELNGYYDRRRETTFSGTVTGKTKGQPRGGVQGMSIMVKTGRVQREVELGPAWYVGRQSAAINLGEKVRVTGVPLRVGRQNVFLARQIRRGNNILALRDAMGMPYWDARRTRVAVTNNSGAAQRLDRRYEGTISGMNTFDIEGESYSGYIVNTVDGPVNVAMAPTWYWNNQRSAFRVGDNVTLFGGTSATNVNGVILVNSVNYPGGTIILRNAGVPVYGGFRPLRP
jgi:hypothetical protein